MASVSFVSGWGCARSNPCCPNFQAFSVISSTHFSKISGNGFLSRSTPLARRGNVAVFRSSLAHEAEIFASVQPQLKSYWFLLLSPSMIPLLALNAESRRQLVEISASTSSIVSKLSPFLDSVQWQGLQRYLVQISAVLVLANAFYANIVPPDTYDPFENVPQDISGPWLFSRKDFALVNTVSSSAVTYAISLGTVMTDLDYF